MWSICLLFVVGSAFASPASQPLYHSQYVGAQAIPGVEYRAQPDATQYLTQTKYERSKGQYTTNQAADRQVCQKFDSRVDKLYWMLTSGSSFQAFQQ